MLALIRADIRSLVHAAVVEGGERHDDREDPAIVRGVGNGLPLLPLYLLPLLVGRRRLLLLALVVRLLVPGVV